MSSATVEASALVTLSLAWRWDLISQQWGCAYENMGNLEISNEEIMGRNGDIIRYVSNSMIYIYMVLSENWDPQLGSNWAF